MIELNLKDIVVKADFSPIYMGQNRKDVIELLGQPENRQDTGTGSVLFSYGGYEFYFFDNELHNFQNDNLKAGYVNHCDCILYQNSCFKIHPWIVSPNKDISMKEIISLLEKEKVEFTIENQKVAGKDYRIDEVKFLELSNGVILEFDNKKMMKNEECILNEKMDFVLYAIRYEHFNQVE